MRSGGTAVAVSVSVGAGVGEGVAGAVVAVGEGGRLVGAWVAAVVDWLSWGSFGIIAACVGSTASAAGVVANCVNKLQPNNPNRLPISNRYRVRLRGVIITGNVVLSKLSFLIPLLYRIDPAALTNQSNDSPGTF
jgi:hypothetical protein